MVVSHDTALASLFAAAAAGGSSDVGGHERLRCDAGVRPPGGECEITATTLSIGDDEVLTLGQFDPHEARL
eukprot:COSAG06_NODE_38742_length_420_cov_0.859813_1_plen_71_part_00